MCRENLNPADVQENQLLELHKDLLAELLRDHATGKNIIWATDDYAHLGAGYGASDEILPELITGGRGRIIMPRAVKPKAAQSSRTRNMAEVFTPTWICNKMNNLADAAWFGRENVFNIEDGPAWTDVPAKIVFPNKNKRGVGSWTAYLAAKRLEITCGEAPYLVSRYDAATGEALPLARRVGLLDRKLRVVNERTRNLRDKGRAQKRWLELAQRALQSTYGFEWQGDNVLLARENILCSAMDYFAAKFGESLPQAWLPQLARIISWNIWQMDGLKGVVPHSCHDYRTRRKPVEPSIFDKKSFSAAVLKRSAGFGEVDENELEKCQGCLKDNIDWHNGVYCKIKNWSTGKVWRFKDLLAKQGSEAGMEKDFKFDVVIGNPPYQSESTDITPVSNNQKPVRNIFQYFQQEADAIANDITCLIYPGGRWIHRFGKGLQEFGLEQINDATLEKIIFYPLANEIFDKVQIADGISIVVKEKRKTGNSFEYEFRRGNVCKSITVKNPGENLLPLNPADIKICEKIDEFVSQNNLAYLHNSILPRSLFKIESNFVEENPDKVKPYNPEEVYDKDKYIKLFTNDKAGKMGRATWYLAERDVITSNKEFINQWQVVVSSANAGGQKRDNQIEIVDDNSAFGRSRVALRSFATQEEATNFFKYANTYLIKYAFLMTDESLTSLGKRVPDIINYKADNELIDFSKDVDKQLYDLIKLDYEDRAYIENKVKSIRK